MNNNKSHENPEIKPAETENEATVSATSDNHAETAETRPEAETAPAQPTPEELLAQANDRFLRARADFENYRKRMAREFNEVRDTAKQQTVADFLIVFDFFAMALEHINQAQDLDAIKQGMLMIQTEFQRCFEKLGVTPIATEGRPFDPALHDAVAHEPSATVPEGGIIRQWKPGFMIGDRVLRVATVVVSAGLPAVQDDAAATDNTGK